MVDEHREMNTRLTKRNSAELLSAKPQICRQIKVKKSVRWFLVPHNNGKTYGPFHLPSKKYYLFNSEDTGPSPFEKFYPLQINSIAATIAMIKNITQIKIAYIFKESVFFGKISLGINCRDGSNTPLFTHKQHLQFVCMI